MKKIICFLVGFALICGSQLMAQQYTAVDYWKMEHDPGYTRLIQRQNTGESLTLQEQGFLVEYKTKLNEYFANLSDNEKSLYYKNRTKWSERPGAIDNNTVQQDAEVFSGEKSAYTQYLISSGVFGFVYGLAAIDIFGLDADGAAMGIPFLVAGTSTLIPILTIKDKNVTYNSLKLSIHGKTMGFIQGAALGLLISGDNIDENGKLLLGLATLSSIGLGRLGYTLGRDKAWSPGRVALYSHYGVLMPLEGFALDIAFESEDPRVYGATSLAFGAGGYFIADRIAQWHDFTKGDITSTQALASLNALLGFCIVVDKNIDSDFSSSDFLVPALGALGGTLAGHLWLKDAGFTNQQGRNTALASAGGAIIGYGLTAIFSPESSKPYYLIPYVTGMSTYAILVNKYKKNNSLAFPERQKTNRWEVNLMPQNILLNRELVNITNAHPEKRVALLPAFSASLHF